MAAQQNIITTRAGERQQTYTCIPCFAAVDVVSVPTDARQTAPEVELLDL